MGFFDKIKNSTVKGLKTVGGATKDLYEKGKEKISKKDPKEKDTGINTDYPKEEQPNVGVQPMPGDTPSPYTNPHSFPQDNYLQQQGPAQHQSGFGSQPNNPNFGGFGAQPLPQQQASVQTQGGFGNCNQGGFGAQPVPQQQLNTQYPTEEEKKEKSMASKALKGAKGLAVGTGKVIGGLFSKIKSEISDSNKKTNFYKLRKSYWEELGFPDGAPIGRELEFSPGSPAYVYYCQKNNIPVDFPNQAAFDTYEQPQVGAQPMPGQAQQNSYSQPPVGNQPNVFGQQPQGWAQPQPPVGNQPNVFGQQTQGWGQPQPPAPTPEPKNKIQKAFEKDDNDKALEQLQKWNDSSVKNKDLEVGLKGLAALNQTNKGINLVNDTFGTKFTLLGVAKTAANAASKLPK